MQNLIDRAVAFGSDLAITENGNAFTYEDLVRESGLLASLLMIDGLGITGQRFCFMVTPGFDYVKTQWAIWRAGGVAVPLCVSHPLPQLEYVIDDTSPAAILCSEEFMQLLNPVCEERKIKLLNTTAAYSGNPNQSFPEIPMEQAALILYTSGTTSKPKGVVLTHKNIEAQIRSLVEAWQWKREDHILSVLPLHHIHGIVNIVCCALWSGACCEFLPAFSPHSVFEKFIGGKVNLFMAVPTIYYKLTAYYDTQNPEVQKQFSECLSKFRLMVSGSAALPVSVLSKWKEISGHLLLERYGMTEIGMALSNPYLGERRAGFVGMPLPGVEVRLCDEKGNPTVTEAGEIQVRGDTVFREYWQRPEATQEAFTQDGWFKTGDLGIMEGGYYRILGRLSVDIIKTGGYKVSALEIEEVLRTYDGIRDCGVVGIDDEEWGERIVAAVVSGPEIDSEELIHWMKQRLPAYKVPRNFKFVTELPRNTMGKVTKKEIKLLFK